MIPILVMLALFSWVPMISQGGSHAVLKVSSGQRSDSALVARMGKVRIVLKDGTMKKNCKIVEMKSYWIVYEKEGSLHDLMIELIERLEIQDGKMNAVFFDERNRPKVGVYVY